MKKRSYSGYKGFDYLDKTDYKQFEYPKGIGWGPKPYEVPLSKEEEERVNRLVENNIVISLHDHLASIPKSLMLSDIEQYQEKLVAFYQHF